MRREVTDDITLSDGTLLRKGSEFMVSARSHWDPALYTNPHEWDGLRFYRFRQQPGNENLGQAAITSVDHLVCVFFVSSFIVGTLVAQKSTVSLSCYYILHELTHASY